MNSYEATPAGHGPLPRRPVLPDLAAARERGPDDLLEARWQGLILSRRWMRERHESLRPGRPYPGIVPLLHAAYAEPGLRRLFPFTSHFVLCLSSSTTHPYDVRVPSVEPLRDGRFRVRQPRSSTVIGHTGTPEEAVALVAARLPPGPGPRP
ncbi:DUF6193 family natural product biosynthesis protein [Streptomyces sp. NPDC005722]